MDFYLDHFEHVSLTYFVKKVWTVVVGTFSNFCSSESVLELPAGFILIKKRRHTPPRRRCEAISGFPKEIYLFSGSLFVVDCKHMLDILPFWDLILQYYTRLSFVSNGLGALRSIPSRSGLPKLSIISRWHPVLWLDGLSVVVVGRHLYSLWVASLLPSSSSWIASNFLRTVGSGHLSCSAQGFDISSLRGGSVLAVNHHG